MKLDLEFIDLIPDNVTPLEAIAMVKCLTEDGRVTWFKISTESLNLMEAFGMIAAALVVQVGGISESFIQDDDDA